MTIHAPEIRAFEQATPYFRRRFKRLPSPMQREVGIVVDELLRGDLRPGRRCEKLKTGEGLYSVRLNANFRFVFQVLENGNARPVAVGPHDEAYRYR